MNTNPHETFRSVIKAYERIETLPSPGYKETPKNKYVMVILAVFLSQLLL
jgi:hypothetical protein